MHPEFHIKVCTTPTKTNSYLVQCCWRDLENQICVFNGFVPVKKFYNEVQNWSLIYKEVKSTIMYSSVDMYNELKNLIKEKGYFEFTKFQLVLGNWGMITNTPRINLL